MAIREDDRYTPQPQPGGSEREAFYRAMRWFVWLLVAFGIAFVILIVSTTAVSFGSS